MKKTNWTIVLLSLWVSSRLVAFFDHDLLSAPDEVAHQLVTTPFYDHTDDADDMVDELADHEDVPHAANDTTTVSQLQATLSLIQSALKQTQEKVASLESHRQDLVRTIERLERQVQALEAVKPQALSTAKLDVHAPSVLTLQQWYDRAFLALKAKRYGEASDLFAKVVQQGGSQLVVADAYYWQGQIQIVQANDLDARQTFTTLLAKFPKYSKAADAWLKLGMVEARLGHQMRARQLFQKVMTLYPESVASQMAKHALSL